MLFAFASGANAPSSEPGSDWSVGMVDYNGIVNGNVVPGLTSSITFTLQNVD